ncbi:XkdX family protein [Paenibacillus sp. QZ-Y1]|uniref:XkdX family protein n=1 Tax=Paenibacillus sp. QZ-Y1 TaxID=3414511 RepID=UPI003F7A9B02
MFKSDYERLKYYYECKWAKESQLWQYVKFGVITEEECYMILNPPIPSTPYSS